MTPPAKGTPPQNKGQKYPPEILTPAEVQALLDELASHRGVTDIRDRALVTLLYRSGLRISEALALRPSDVDFASHSIRLLDTKSGQPQTRGFHPTADDALLRWIDARKAAGIGNHGRKLFCTLRGTPVSSSQVRHMLKRTAEAAGIDKRVHPHGFRHTFSAELEAAGVPVTVVSKLLGHSGVAVTSRYLDHLTNQQAVSALSEVVLPELGRQAGGQPERDLQAEVTELRRRLAALEERRQGT